MKKRSVDVCVNCDWFDPIVVYTNPTEHRKSFDDEDKNTPECIWEDYGYGQPGFWGRDLPDKCPRRMEHAVMLGDGDATKRIE